MRIPWIQKWRAWPETRRTVLITAILLGVLMPWTDGASGFWRSAFVMPTAHLAGGFLGVDCVPTSDGGLLMTPGAPVHVTLACSAARFFVLLLALLAGQALARFPTRVASLAAAILSAYGVAIVANVARVILAWWAGNWAERVLPPHFAAAVHMGTGIFVFLVFLVGTWVAFVTLQSSCIKERRHERREIRFVPVS